MSSETYSIAKEIIYITRHNYTALCSSINLKPLLFSETEKELKHKFEILSEYDGSSYSDWKGVFEKTDVLDLFLSAGLLIQDKFNYDKLPEEVNDKKTFTLVFVTNSGCNLGCVYCYEGKTTLTNSNRISFEQAKSVIDSILIGDISGAEITVNFIGGEPLLHWAIIKKICDYIINISHSYNCKHSLSIQTNLTFLPDGFVDYIKSHDIVVIANIDGPEYIHNALRPYKVGGRSSYIDTLNCLNILKDKEIIFYLHCTITSLNSHLLVEVSELHQQVGAKSSIFGLLRPSDFDGKSMGELLPSTEYYLNGLKRLINHSIWKNHYLNNVYTDGILKAKKQMENNCSASSPDYYVIDQSGHFYNCIYLVNDSQFKNGMAGSINKTEKSNTADILKRANDPVCSKCAYKNVCLACPITRLINKHNSLAVDKVRELHCIETKTIVNHLLMTMANENNGFQSLNDEWKSWIIDSIQDGVSDEAMIRAMEETMMFQNLSPKRLIEEARLLIS